MPNHLRVKKSGNKVSVSWKSNHPKSAKINAWLKYLSPGYVEYLLRYDNDPHCNACRAKDCDNVGRGDDACPGFIFGNSW